MYHGSATVVGCTISGNSAYTDSAGDFGGGGMVLNASSVAIIACTISGNDAASTGGGIDIHSGSVRLTACKFAGNSAGSTGGGLNVEAGRVVLSACSFFEQLGRQSRWRAECLWRRRIADRLYALGQPGRSAGGGLNVSAGTVAMTRSWVSHDLAGRTGGGLNVSGGSVALTHCALGQPGRQRR